MKIKLMCLSQSTYCSEGVGILIPHEDKVAVITRINTCHNGESGRTLRLRTADNMFKRHLNRPGNTQRLAVTLRSFDMFW